MYDPRAKQMFKVLLFIISGSIALTPITLFLYEFFLDKQASGTFVCLGSMGLLFLLGIMTGDFPSRFGGYHIPANKKKQRFLVASLGFTLGAILLFTQPVYKSCEARIVSYEFKKTKDHVFPFLNLECLDGTVMVKLAAIHNREEVEPILESAKVSSARVQISYSKMRGLAGLVIGGETLKDPNKSQLQSNAFALAFLQSSFLVLLIGILNLRIPRYGLKRHFLTMNKSEREGD